MLKRLLFCASTLLVSQFSLADECSTTIESNDAMQYNKSELVIPATCEDFTVTLKHTGNLPKQAMGHNWVMTKEDDAQPVATAGISAGMENNYIKPDDERVIAATDIIGGGESTSTTFSVKGLNKSDAYLFFCSFPGHIGIMKGTVTFES